MEQFLSDIESDLVERKESWSGDAPDKGRQAVCAFANDLPDRRKPGVLFVGAKDDGSPSNLSITDELLQTLSDIKTDGNILPLPSLLVEKHRLQGAEMAVVTVQPADSPPVRYKGRIWIRIGPRRAIATAQDERILNEKRRFKDSTFDIQPVPSSSIKDLNLLYFESEYLPNIFSPDVLEANDRSMEQRLCASKMIASLDTAEPTVLGLLTLGHQPRDWFPGAYIQFLRIDGQELTDDIIDEASIDGRLAQVLQRIDEKLKSHNRVSVDLKDQPKERRDELYPSVALQQIVRNAVMHRTYEGTNSPVRITWYNDRIEIQNPGGPYGTVTQDNFGQPGITDYRNPNLAEAMKALGFVQRFGVGIAHAQKALQENGNPPLAFQCTSSNVLAVIWGKE